jgi:probable biosynthetic protein (TIGR04098 family)
MRIASRRDRDARHTEARRLHRRLAVRARVTAGAVASPGTLLPEAARRLRIGMPHLDAGGLSENWLFRAAGDLHWEAITRRLGVPTHEIETSGHERLYPMVIALRARYDAPLSAVRENDVLTWSVDVVPCGGACARGLIVARIGDRCFRLELLTSFAERRSGGTMRMALPAARLAARWKPASAGTTGSTLVPLGGSHLQIAQLARAARRGDPLDDAFCGPTLATAGPPLDELDYQPSPYADYNGVGLLYFASYVTIAAGAERQMVGRLGLVPPELARRGDWSVIASPVRRDLFFYGNLPLGETLRTQLLAATSEAAAGGDGPATLKTHLRLGRLGQLSDDGTGGRATDRAIDRSVMADIVSRYALGPGGRT